MLDTSMSDAEYEVGEFHSSFVSANRANNVLESVTKARVDGKRGKKLIWVSSRLHSFVL